MTWQRASIDAVRSGQTWNLEVPQRSRQAAQPGMSERLSGEMGEASSNPRKPKLLCAKPPRALTLVATLVRTEAALVEHAAYLAGGSPQPTTLGAEPPKGQQRSKVPLENRRETMLEETRVQQSVTGHPTSRAAAIP